LPVSLLKSDAVLQGPGIMAEMKGARGAVPGENDRAVVWLSGHDGFSGMGAAVTESR